MPRLSPTRLITICTVTAVLLLMAAPIIADDVAAIPDSADERARTSFSDFARSWMVKMQENEAQNRKNPIVQPGPSENIVTYRGFDEGFTVELRPTGHPVAPFVGILRYNEQVYSCNGVDASKCSVASSLPVTEIFRYQGGRWVY
jgi:ABC-type Fe2+-enterobactin transport system substrate-binding protein